MSKAQGLFYGFWFSSAADLEARIAQAARQYLDRFGARPRALVLNPATAPALEVPGVAIERQYWIAKGAAYFVLPEEVTNGKK